MRRWPRFIVPVVAVVYYLALPVSTQRAFELSVQRAAVRLRAWFGAADRVDSEAPRLDPVVARTIGRSIDPRLGRARVGRIVARSHRLRLIVERGRDDGIELGDVAVIEDDDATFLIGDVVARNDRFAEVRTLLDRDAWWLARTPESRIVVVADRERPVLRLRRPERQTRLRDGDPVVTAEDLSGERVVPGDLRIGTLSLPGTDFARASIALDRDPRGTLSVSFIRAGVPIDLGPARRSSHARWIPIEVAVGRDAGHTRASIVARGTDDAFAVDLPVARGGDLEGWVRVVGRDEVHVRLVRDPGFIAHVLALRIVGDEATVVASAIFRGAGGRSAIDGVLGTVVGDIEVGDRLVLGPHEGAGGVGLSLGRVVHSFAGGRVTLDRTARFRRGEVVWVGVSPRPPDSIGEGGAAP